MPLKTRRNKEGEGNEELISQVIDKAIKDYNKDDYLSSSPLRQIYLSLMYFLISFDKGYLNIDFTELPDNNTKLIKQYLNKVLKQFSEDELNEILGVDNFRVYAQVGNYIANQSQKNKPKNISMPARLKEKIERIHPLSEEELFEKKNQRPLYRAPVIKTNLIQPIEEEEQFNERHSAGGSFKRQRTIKVIRKY